MTRNTESFKIRDGRMVTIQIDDFGNDIDVFDDDGKEIGSINLLSVDGEHGYYYKIVWMYLDKQGGSYLHQGIGREALRFHKQCFDSPIEASDDDGHVRSDGSHLTGDAPGFIRKMVDEGLVFTSSALYGSENDA